VSRLPLAALLLALPLPLVTTAYYVLQFPDPPVYVALVALGSLLLACSVLVPSALFFAKRTPLRTDTVIGVLVLLAALSGLASFGLATFIQRLPHGSWRPSSPPEPIARFTQDSYAFFGMGALVAQAQSGRQCVIQCRSGADCSWSTPQEYQEALAVAPRASCPSSDLEPYYIPPRLPSPALSTGVLMLCDHAQTTFVHIAALRDSSLLLWSNPRTSASFWGPIDMTLLGSLAGMIAASTLLLRPARRLWRRERKPK
jgi:hypothetical protein